MAFGIELKAAVEQQFDFTAVNDKKEAMTNKSGIFKAYIPNFLYKPPYGYPHNKNVDLIRKLGYNGYIFSIKSAIKDRISSTSFDVKLREEFQKDENGERVDALQFEEQRKKIISFFDKPNLNKESFGNLLRKLVEDILELDAGVWIKVFNKGGEFQQLFSYDGGTFLKNPDIHGYLGNRAEFVMPSQQFLDQDNLMSKNNENSMVNEQVVKMYDQIFKSQAAYFQYGWTAGSMPVPFGNREVVYMMRNPRSDNIYGTAPLEVLSEIVLTLVYGSTYNLDFYVNNNMPDGIIQLLGANEQQIRSFRSRFEAEFKDTDAFNNYRRKFHTYPITSKEAKFTQFQLSSEQMQILEQQKWFVKIVWACFGINASELGFTEDSNKATEVVQSDIGKKKLIGPMLKLIEYHINNDIMPEFEAPMFEFKFDDYDIAEDKARHELLETEIRMGVKTAEMAAEELGIDVARLVKEKEEAVQKQQDMMEKQSEIGIGEKEDDDKKEKDPFQKTDEDAKKKEVEQKANEPLMQPFEKEVIGHMRDVKKDVVKLIEGLNKNELGKIQINSNIKGIPEDILKALKNIFSVDTFAPLVTASITKSFMKGLETSENELDQNFVPNKRATDFLSDQTFKNVKGMTDEVSEKLRKELGQAIVNRDSIPEMKDRIQKAFDVGEVRAKAIARTESNRALNQGRLEGARQSRLNLVKQWDSHLDDRTSPICNHLDGKIVGLNEKFSYNGENFDAPPSHVNCRSRLVFIQKEDLE